jgi:hypothetical protein
MGSICAYEMFRGCSYYHSVSDSAAFMSQMRQPLQKVFAIWFTVLALLFTTAATFLLYTLKQAYASFYVEFRCLLISTTLVMALPLIFRAAVDISLNFTNEFWHKASDRQITFYNVAFFLCATYV